LSIWRWIESISCQFQQFVVQKSLSLPETAWDKSKACFGRLQNSPLAQAFVIADPKLCQDLLAETLSTASHNDYLPLNKYLCRK